MEILKNYLESMFARLPINHEVLRAKEELLQMMEDKYNGLVSEGKSENEVIGIVIAEFGNLDDLADALGIGEFVNPVEKKIESQVERERIESFLKAKRGQAFKIALGVALCILSISGVALGSLVGPDGTFGVILFFIFIAAGVSIFIFTEVMMGKWDDIREKRITIDFSTRRFLEEEKERMRSTHSIHLTVGIMLCIVSVLPPIVADSIRVFNSLEEFSVAFMFFFIAAGVFLIVQTSILNGAYTNLLKKSGQDMQSNIGLNNGGYYNDESGYVYDSKGVAAVMSVYWSTVTCLYLAVSFLSFDWHITWIIWPIAAICHKLINSTCGRKIR